MTTPDQGGAPQEAPPAAGQQGGNGMAIAGLVFAIIGLVTFWIPFAGLGIGVLALILSIIGKKKSAEVGGAGSGAAVAGIVIAILAIVAGGASTACAVACGAAAQQMQEELDKQARDQGYDDYNDMVEKGGGVPAGFGDFGKAMEEAFEKAAEEATKEAEAAKEAADEGAE